MDNGIYFQVTRCSKKDGLSFHIVELLNPVDEPGEVEYFPICPLNLVAISEYGSLVDHHSALRTTVQVLRDVVYGSKEQEPLALGDIRDTVTAAAETVFRAYEESQTNSFPDS